MEVKVAPQSLRVALNGQAETESSIAGTAGQLELFQESQLQVFFTRFNHMETSFTG